MAARRTKDDYEGVPQRPNGQRGTRTVIDTPRHAGRIFLLECNSNEGATCLTQNTPKFHRVLVHKKMGPQNAAGFELNRLQPLTRMISPQMTSSDATYTHTPCPDVRSHRIKLDALQDAASLSTCLAPLW